MDNHRAAALPRFNVVTFLRRHPPNTSSASSRHHRNQVAPRSAPGPERCEKKQPPNRRLSRPPVDARHFAGSKSIVVPAAPPARLLKHSIAIVRQLGFLLNPSTTWR